jgi:hypothetical protein
LRYVGFVQGTSALSYNLRMRTWDRASAWAFRLLLCLSALSLGWATARYTDIARYDLTRQSLRASVR